MELSGYVSDVHHWSCGALSGITRSGNPVGLYNIMGSFHTAI